MDILSHQWPATINTNYGHTFIPVCNHQCLLIMDLLSYRQPVLMGYTLTEKTTTVKRRKKKTEKTVKLERFVSL